MQTHGPGCLPGPISRGRSCWKSPSSSAPGQGSSPSGGARPPEGAPIRRELVERVRKEIEAGVYDTPEKFDIALERLLRRLEDD